MPKGPANANVVWHEGRLLALVEGGLPPVELDPEALDTRGIFASEGKLRRHDPIYVPLPSMVHDFITTRKHVLFPIFPATLRPERMALGESVLGWEPDLCTRIGVMPRSGGNADVQWFETDPCYVFHLVKLNPDRRRVFCEVAQSPRLPLPLPGEGPDIVANASLVRWTLDLDAGTVKQEPQGDRVIEFPRFDERCTGLDHRYGFAGSGALGAIHGFNQLVRYDMRTGATAVHEPGLRDAVGEAIFVPRSAAAPEGGRAICSRWPGEARSIAATC